MTITQTERKERKAGERAEKKRAFWKRLEGLARKSPVNHFRGSIRGESWRGRKYITATAGMFVRKRAHKERNVNRKHVN